MKKLDDLRFLIHEPPDIYEAKADAYLTSHRLKEFREDPLLYHKRKIGLVPREGDRPAYMLGRAAHRLILEGRKSFEDGYAVGGPVNPKTGEVYGRQTKAFAEWMEAQGKPALTFDEAALIENLNASVRAHQAASELLARGEAEGVVRAKYHGVLCQARFDWLNPERGIVDLKTADSLTFFEVGARAYGYIHQLAFYRAVLAEIIGQLVPAHIVAVEKQEPYRSGVWLVGEDVLAQVQKENEQAMDRLKVCERSGLWPTGYEDVRTLDSL